MEWTEIKDPRRVGLERFGGLHRFVGSQPHVSVEGILYYNHGDQTGGRSHTIIYRSEQKKGEWSQNIRDILEITNIVLSHEEAIERCKKYAK